MYDSLYTGGYWRILLISPLLRYALRQSFVCHRYRTSALMLRPGCAQGSEEAANIISWYKHFTRWWMPGVSLWHGNCWKILKDDVVVILIPLFYVPLRYRYFIMRMKLFVKYRNVHVFSKESASRIGLARAPLADIKRAHFHSPLPREDMFFPKVRRPASYFLPEC